MSINEMTAKIKELKSLQALIEEAEAEADALKDQIKEAMGDSEELRVGEYKVTYKTVKSSRFDSKSLKAELPEIAERYTVATEYRRFAIAYLLTGYQSRHRERRILHQPPIQQDGGNREAVRQAGTNGNGAYSKDRL